MGRKMPGEPLGQRVHARKPGSRPSVEFGVGGQLTLPASHLPAKPAVRSPQVGDAGCLRIDSSQGGERVDHRQTHLPLQSNVRGKGLRDLAGDGEPSDRLHQEEAAPEDVEVVTRRDQRRMGNAAVD